MHWFNWVLVIVLGVSVFINITQIGKEGKPTSPLSVAITTLIVGLLIAGIVIFRG